MTLAIAGIGRRLASMLYEGLVVFSVLLIGFWLPQALLSAVGLVLTPRLLWLHVLLLLMFYFVWFWLHGGQTLPMKTWKLRITNPDGTPPRPLQAVLRYLAAWPSVLLFGVGILWALIDRDRQFLHDRIAGTRIVNCSA
ncbi:MAG: RDD family protein [Betaproteobacteria bacterium HGW-Betaproteobacteria-12]|nr:MAG: RDD family protein [Betaproteobacteria bacterium HGW-Betaproteobacteria-12]